MKLLPLLLLFFINSFSQKSIDRRSQIEKENLSNIYKPDKVNKLNLIEALELASIRIHKFNIGTFVKKYKFEIFADEYYNNKLIKTDTLLNYNNEYSFWTKDKDNNDKHNKGFIDQIRFFTKTNENNSVLKIKTYDLKAIREINLNKINNHQFYNWREYENTKWKLNKKVPLLLFASSWFDKRINSHRFCGTVKLKENEKETQNLLNYSKNYIIINYKMSELN